MKTFRQYLIETVSKNVHLEHLEDEVFNAGVLGTRKALSFLIGLRNMLAGAASSPVSVSVKWDGAPSIVCGVNPENGKFFVATKSAFNKTPKLNYTHADIDRNHEGGLADTLKVALTHLSGLKISGIIQGDVLFTRNSLKQIRIGGENLIAFRPNTITYAVPAHSKIASEILAANLGVVFHTSYTGKTIASLKASFGVNVSGFRKTPNVWVTDASFRDEAGTATLTKAETDYVSSRLTELGHLFNNMDAAVISLIVDNAPLKALIKTYVNDRVRTGENISGTRKYAAGLVEFITQKFTAEIDKLKTERGKANRTEQLTNMLKFIRVNREQFMLMFTIAAIIADVKGVLLSKLRKVSSIGTFLETSDGFKVTSPEGFVAVDRIGNAVKLVDRLEFSRANFNLEKSW